MTPYYFLAIAFGGLSALLSVYAIWVRKDHAEFPGRLYVPIMLAGAAFAAATLTFVIIGGNKENKEKRDKAAATAGLAKSSRSAAG
jgi:phosphotransferase system  glucose/maltose/N-acetylglucosamine-specific IIC component